MNAPKFIVDHNVGKLARWLRLMGYDAERFGDGDDSYLVARALRENRVLVTRDTQLMKRGVISNGTVKAVLVSGDDSERQMRQVIRSLNIDTGYRPFRMCLECNSPLEERSREQVKDRVPPYVYKTREYYMECPVCHRIYWRGTHWMKMNDLLDEFRKVSL